nr:GEVED domain-containing protein [uncultured Arsenicibacter sp.]
MPFTTPFIYPVTRYRLFVLQLIILCCTLSSFAQQTYLKDTLTCSTGILTKEEQAVLEKQLDIAYRFKKASGNAADAITYIPIKPHIVRMSDGSGLFTIGRLNQVLALAQPYFINRYGGGFQFYFCGTAPDYIDEDAFYKAFPDKEYPCAPRDAINALNMYFLNEFEFGFKSAYSYYPQNNLKSTRSFYLTNKYYTDSDLGQLIVPHELGHTFNLYHTFQGSLGTNPELVTRGSDANCSTAGDLLCDTPADPYGKQNTNVIRVDGCPVYVGTATDPQGLTYSPSLNNLMGYYASCKQYEFTDGQYDRMQAGLALRQTHNYYSLNCPPTTVNAPTNLKAETGNGIRLTWTDNAGNETGYFIERASARNGRYRAVGGVGPDNTQFMDIDVKPDSTYFYRIRPSNTTLAALSDTVEVKAVTVPACIPSYRFGCQQGDGLQGVKLNGYVLSNKSGCSITGYDAFAAKGVQVVPGQQLRLDVSLLNSVVDEQIILWLDADRNGLFDAGEVVLKTKAKGGITQHFVLPADMGYGRLAMRIMVTPSASSTAACDSYTYGETEDYWLEVIESACSVPVAITANVQDNLNRVTINWKATGSDNQYELRWKLVQDTSWTVVTGLTGLSYDTDLLPGCYQYQVKTVCPAGVSVYSGGELTVGCSSPAHPEAMAISKTSALLFWQHTGPGELQWRDIQGSWSKPIAVSSPPFALTGLLEGHFYQWQIKSVCNSSLFAESSFTTQGICIPAGRGCPSSTEIRYILVNGMLLDASGCTTNGYVSFADKPLPVEKSKELTIAISVNYYPGFVIWLDWNQNSVFEPDEVIYNYRTNSSNELPFTLRLFVKNTLKSGLLRMRIRLMDDSGFSTDPCADNPTGETRDYAMLVVDKPDILISSYAASVCTGQSFNVSFGASSVWESGNSYTLQLSDPDGVFGENPVQIGTIASTYYPAQAVRATIPADTKAGTGYRIRMVSTKPAVTGTSAGLLGIATNCACMAPASLSVTYSGTDEATLSWAKATGAVSYAVRWRPVGTEVWQQAESVTEQKYTIRDLKFSTDYEWQVKSTCNSTTASEWGIRNVFQTGSCKPAAFLSGTKTANAGEWILMPVKLTGKPPWQMVIMANGSPLQHYSNPLLNEIMLSVSPATSTTYTISGLTNDCGEGTVTGSFIAYVIDPCQQMYTIASGAWNDPAIWSCNRVPASTDAVCIRHWVTVLPATTAAARLVKYDLGGRLMVNSQTLLQLNR